METGITVLGGGSWGTVLANLASLNGNCDIRDNFFEKIFHKFNISKLYYQIFPNLLIVLFILSIFIIFNKFHEKK